MNTDGTVANAYKITELPGVRWQAKRDAAFKREWICQTERLAQLKSGVTAAARQDGAATALPLFFLCVVAAQAALGLSVFIRGFA